MITYYTNSNKTIVVVLPATHLILGYSDWHEVFKIDRNNSWYDGFFNYQLKPFLIKNITEYTNKFSKPHSINAIRLKLTGILI